jgi:hypothetical protein
MKASFVVLVAAAAVAAGCRKQESVGPNGEKVTVDERRGTVTVATGEGTATLAQGSGSVVPADFPKDVPIYPGGKVTGAVASAGSVRSGHMLTIQTSDAPEKVADFYKTALSGWKPELDVASSDGRTLMLQSPDRKRTVMLNATHGSGGKTDVALTVAANQ